MNWDSPYQTIGFHEALKNSGFQSVRYPTSDGVVYANNWVTPELTAWEISGPRRFSAVAGLQAFVFEEIVTYEKVRTGEASFYYTPVIRLDSDFRKAYSPSCKRNIARGASSHLAFEKIVCADFHKAPGFYLQLLLRMPQNCNGYAEEKLTGLVAEILRSGCGELFIITNEAGRIIGVCVLIHSGNVANLRFSAIDRQYSSSRPMNYMVDLLADHYAQQGMKILDLSGFATTAITESGQNINRFKKGFTHQFAVFKKTMV